MSLQVSFRLLEDRRQASAARRNSDRATVRSPSRPRAGRRAVQVKQIEVASGAPDASPLARAMPGTEGATASASSIVPAGPRLNGVVTRLIRSKRLPSGTALGIVRSAAFDGWSKGKRADGTSATVDEAAVSFLNARNLQAHLVPGDHLFWLADVCEEHQASLQKQDEVEYSVEPRRVEDDSERVCDMAVNIVRIRQARVNQPTARWQPPPMPSATDAPRKAPKFSGTAAIVVPGPAKGAVSFQAGRGRPLADPASRVSAFRFDDQAVKAAFIPNVASLESFRTCQSSGDLAVLMSDGGTVFRSIQQSVQLPEPECL